MAGALVALVLIAVVRLPSGTSAPTLALRAGVGLLLGTALVVVTRRILRSMTEPPPPPPPALDARATDVVYECIVCGTRVRLEVAATGKPPKHCGEEMEAGLAT